MSLSDAIGSSLWYASDLAFRWIPGVIAALATGESESGHTALQFPVFTGAVTTGQLVDFLRINADPALYSKVANAWQTFVGISTFLSLIFGALMIYSTIRIFQHRRAHYRHIEHLQHTIMAHDIPQTRLRFDRIREQISSENEQSWRLAILEADIMLGELLDTLGYRGETLADKMRQVDRSDFRTIDIAWEAHRMRNRIAHEGNALSLNHREARRVIDLYEAVFREFDFVA